LAVVPNWTEPPVLNPPAPEFTAKFMSIDAPVLVTLMNPSFTITFVKGWSWKFPSWAVCAKTVVESKRTAGKAAIPK